MLSLVSLISIGALVNSPGGSGDALTRRKALELAGLGASGTLLGSGGPAVAAVDGASTASSTAAAALSGGKLALPAIGLGAWAWGDSLFWGYDPKKDGELQDVFDYAVSNGCTLFDTAEIYGFGRSESLLGKFIARNPTAASDVQVATKFAALPWRTKANDVLEAAKKSTDRLGRPIDLYQIHFPNAWANEQYWDGLGEAAARGLVKGVGVSNYGSEALRACHAKLASRGVPLVSNQIQLSLLYPYCLENGLKATCDELDVTVLAYSPIALGLLAGKFALDGTLPDGPRRPLAEKYLADPKFGLLLDAMRQIGAAHDGASPATVAIAWCIAKGTVPIPGARTIKQARGNLAARELKLSAVEVATLDAAAKLVTPVLSPEVNPFPKKDVFTGLPMYQS